MRLRVSAALAAMVLAVPAHALTFTIAMNGQTTTFEAPAAGGPISNFEITISGTSFDMLLPGNDTPTYNVADNDFKSGDGGIFSYVTNSNPGPGCLVGDCLLEFEDRADPEVPPIWAAFSLTELDVFAAGEYVISPGPDGVVPLPPALATMLGGLGLLWGLKRRGRARGRPT